MNSWPNTWARPCMGSKGTEFCTFAKISAMRYGSLILLLALLGCGQGKKYHQGESEVPNSPVLADILKFQQGMDESFRDPETSPLPDRFRKNFEGLEFFAPDTT